MTVLKNTVLIQAPRERVWAALARLDSLQDYDPGISKSLLRSDQSEGVGADRHCDIRAGGWFRERVTLWRPPQELELTLYECTLPVRALRHHYRLTPEGEGTRIDQIQEYELKYGFFGSLLDSRGAAQVGHGRQELLQRPQAVRGGGRRAVGQPALLRFPPSQR